MNNPTFLVANKMSIEQHDWGELTWYASGALGNSDHMTLGTCTLKPGCENPVHSHANCEEVLHVLAGHVRHWVEGQAEIEMGAGDTLTIPPHVSHNATNVGLECAVLLVAFSTPDRKVEGE